MTAELEPWNHAGEGLRCDRDTILALVHVITRADDHQRGHGADNDCVDEGFEQGDNALTRCKLGLGRCMSNGRRTNTSLIGESSTLESNQKHSDHTPSHRFRIKGHGEDQIESLTDLGLWL